MITTRYFLKEFDNKTTRIILDIDMNCAIIFDPAYPEGRIFDFHLESMDAAEMILENGFKEIHMDGIFK